MSSRKRLKVEDTYGDERLMCIDKNKSIRAYNRQEKTWWEVIQSVPWMDDDSSVQKYLDGLIVVGAGTSEGDARVAYLDVKAGVQYNLPDLPHGVWGAGIVSMGEEVYVLGGYCNGILLNTTWKLSDKQQWEQLPPLIHAVSASVCTIHKDTVYVIGSSSSSTDNLVQSFNMATKTWVLKERLPRGCYRYDSGVVSHEGNLVVITKDQMMSYDDVTDSWNIIMYDSITDDGWLTVVEHGGQICAYVRDEQKVMQYDQYDNSWNLMAGDVPQLCEVHMMLSVK